MQKYRKIRGIRLHELEHDESKMRLLKTYSHTSGWRSYGALDACDVINHSGAQEGGGVCN